MKKSIVLTLFSMFIMVISSSANASVCSYTDSGCAYEETKIDSEKLIHSGKFIDNTVVALLSRVEFFQGIIDDNVKDESSYWNNNEYVAFGLFLHGYKNDHGVKGHHGDKGHLSYKGWWESASELQGYGDGIPQVPVPASIWLFGSGLIALAAFTRRKLR